MNTSRSHFIQFFLYKSHVDTADGSKSMELNKIENGSVTKVARYWRMILNWEALN